MNDITIDSSVEPWILANIERNFTLDGNGKTLEYYINFGDEAFSSHMGLFSTLNYATVKNINLKGEIIANTTGYLGGIAGSMYRTTVSNVISEVKVTNNCQTDGYAGGIAGQFGGKHSDNEKSLIENTAVYADVYGDTAGGLVGLGWNGTQYYDIENCAYVGDVYGYNIEGAIVGYQATDSNTSSFTNIYWSEVNDSDFYGKRDTDNQVYTKTEAKKWSAFTKGEVTYLLNNGVTDGTQVWFQNVDNDVDEYDIFPMHTGGTVYRNTNCVESNINYSNECFPVEHRYNQYYVCKDCISLMPNKATGVYGFSIGLSGNISVKYYTVIDEEVAADPTAKMVFTVPDTGSTYTVEIPVSEAETTQVTVSATGETKTLYIFECEVAAKEMTSVIKAQIVTSEYEGDVFEYTVKEYAEVILSDTEKYPKEQELVKAMLNYGAYAQLYFDHNTDDLANDSLFVSIEDRELVDELDLSAYANSTSGEQEGVSFYGGALSLKSETAIKLYFVVDSNVDINSLGITVNGEEATAEKNGKYYEVKISDIPAHKLHDIFEVKVGGLTVNYGAFSYGNTAMGTDKDTLKNVIKSMYVYNQSAFEYVC